MGHRAALYMVKVRPHREVDGWRLLGDYDKAGSSVASEIDEVLGKLDVEKKDQKVKAVFDQPLPDLAPNQVGACLVSGKLGVTAVLSRKGDPPFDQTPDHSQDMRTGVLFDLPPASKTGRLVVHVPEGRSIKRLTEREIAHRFSQKGFIISIDPVVPGNALAQAVERDAIERVTLIKHSVKSNDKFADAAQWGTDELDRVELSLPSRRNRRLRRDPLKKFLNEPTETNRKRLYTFQGLEFDEVGVTVDLPDGSRRMFFVEPRTGGHPLTVALAVDKTDRYGATPQVLSRELKAVLKSVSAARGS